jgi:gliding motility-associated-like protein
LAKGLTSFKMSVFNRWGQQVFESRTLEGSGWDGKLNGVAQPEGVYVYIIDVTFRDGQKEYHKGNITLMR